MGGGVFQARNYYFKKKKSIFKKYGSVSLDLGNSNHFNSNHLISSNYRVKIQHFQ